MTKKLISLLLAVCMIFCLSACGTTETNSKPTDTPTESQTDKPSSTDETTSTQSENSQVSSNIEETNENDTQTQTTVSQSKPTSTTNQPTHTHSYSNATCTEPQKCNCGATTGNPLGHNYSDATCTSPKECARCGSTEGTALGHQFTSATCTNPQKCSRCGTIGGKALGHNYSEANCTSPKKCTRCGSTEGKALGHKYEKGVCTICKVMDEGKYVEEQIKAADKAFKDYTKYNDALKIIKAALQKYPQNDTLKAKRDYYQSFEPLDLCDLKPYKKSYAYISNGSSSDNFENDYEKCVYKPHYNSNASATYDLGYKYNSFKATVFMRCDCTRQVYGTIKIYGDGSLLYNKTGIDVYGRPFNMEVDVTGVQDLEIVIESESGAYIFGLGNCVLQRTSK